MLVSKLSDLERLNLNISTHLMIKAAINEGYEVDYTESSINASGLAVCKKNGFKDILFVSTATELAGAYAHNTANNKILTNNLLVGNGVPTPNTKEISKDDIATFEFEKDDSYVVKPLSTNHGDGITIGVENRDELEQAVEYALSFDDSQKTVLLQRRVYGEEYRFLVLDKNVIAVAGREPAYVIGDGVSTIRILIVEKNKDPNRRDGHKGSLTKIDVGLVAKRKGDDFLDFVPKHDEKVRLLDTSNLSKGGEAIDYTDVVSPELKKIAENAANACELGLAGVDIMTDNLENPTTAYVIEVNYVPGIRMHTFPSGGKKRDVAGMIISKLSKTID